MLSTISRTLLNISYVVLFLIRCSQLETKLAAAVASFLQKKDFRYEKVKNVLTKQKRWLDCQKMKKDQVTKE